MTNVHGKDYFTILKEDGIKTNDKKKLLEKVHIVWCLL